MARSFNGLSDRIQSAITNFPTGTTVRSIFCWINCPVQSPSGIHCFFSYGGTPGANSAVYFSVDTNLLHVDSYGTGWDSTVNVATSTWRPVGFTWDGTTTRTYVDGVQDSTNAGNAFNTTTTIPTADFGTDEHNGAGSYSRFFNGSIAEVAIWNVVLTVSEAAALAKGARSNTVRSASLKGYWPLGGAQSPEPDFSGLANNGTLTGTNPAFGPPLMQFTPRWPQIFPLPSPFILMPQIVT
jgi:hypothetical protein